MARNRSSVGPEWTDDDLARLRAIYPHARTVSILHHFPGKTALQVRRKAHECGIGKTSEARAQSKREDRIRYVAECRAAGRSANVGRTQGGPGVSTLSSSATFPTA